MAVAMEQMRVMALSNELQNAQVPRWTTTTDNIHSPIMHDADANGHWPLVEVYNNQAATATASCKVQTQVRMANDHEYEYEYDDSDARRQMRMIKLNLKNTITMHTHHHHVPTITITYTRRLRMRISKMHALVFFVF